MPLANILSLQFFEFGIKKNLYEQTVYKSEGLFLKSDIILRDLGLFDPAKILNSSIFWSLL